MKVPPRFVLRELGLLLLLGAAWWAESRWVELEGTLVFVYRVFVGLLTVLAGALLHEWGHLLASLATRAVVHFPPGWAAKLLFDFDVEANDRRQFLAMSWGGYLGSAVGVVLFAALLPWDRLAGQVAILGAALGMLVSMIIEMPTTLRVLRGAEPPAALLTVAGRRPED